MIYIYIYIYISIAQYTGLPDTHVEAHLLPPGDAMKKSVIKTEVVKKSLNPNFKNEVYEM